MTANQIEYQKLLETKRHNIVTEGYEKPFKDSQTAMNYASIGLIHEQVATQESVRAANLASAAASYASAVLSYERVNTEQSQQNLNREKANTEVAQQYGILASGDYAAARTKGQELENTILIPDAAVAVGTTTLLHDSKWASNAAVAGDYYNRYLSKGVPDVAKIIQTNNAQRNDLVLGAAKAIFK